MLKKLSLRSQLVLIISATSLFALFVFFAAFFAFDQANAKAKLISDSDTQVKILAQNSVGALSFSDTKAAYETLNALSSNRDVQAVALYDVAGNTLGAYNAQHSEAPPYRLKQEQDQLIQTDKTIEITRPVRLENELLGYIYYRASMKSYEDRRMTYLGVSGGLMLFTLLIATCVGVLLQRWFTAPILRLHEAIGRVRDQQAYFIRVEHLERNELGQLIDGFNKMLGEIEKRDQDLHAANEELFDFFENAPVGILWADAEGCVTRVNRAEKELRATDEHQIVGRHLRDLFVDDVELKLALGKLAEGRTLANLELEIVNAADEKRIVQINANGLFASNTYVGSRWFSRDITKLKQAEAERNAQAEEARKDKIRAERANQAKSEFLSRISHELRTPMNAILGFGQLLELAPMEDRPASFVQQILKAGRHLLGLINEVLDFSRIESGTMSISLEAVPLTNVLRETVELAKPLGAERGIEIVCEYDQDQPVQVHADLQRISQVLINLLSNAVKYNVDGGKVRIKLHRPKSGRVAIWIEDTGVGIPPDKVDRIFTPFDRLGAESTEIEGTGLGLSFSHCLAEAMGGTLAYDESYAGPGSRFILEMRELLEGHAQSEQSGLSAEVREGDHPRKVLVIDDNSQNRQLVASLLERLDNVQGLFAMQGRLGIEMARFEKPDLILLDVNMGDIQGYEVAAKLREFPETRDTPIVVMTADGSERTRRQFEDQTIFAWISKPIVVHDLISVITNVLDKGVKKVA